MSILYSSLKAFNFKDTLDSLRTETIKSPIHIRIKPTNICNHNCWYCAYKSDKLQLGKDMVTKDYIPKEKMLEIVDDLAEMGVKAVTFSGGGEPFCYPYLANAVRRLSQTKIKFGVLTNGARVAGEAAEVFAHCGTWLRVSMDGWNDASYMNYRGVQDGEFRKIMGNMEHFKKLGGKCYLGVSLIIDMHNAYHIFELTQRLKGIGVDSIKMSACVVSNDGQENRRYHKPFFDEARSQIDRAKESLADDNFEIFDTYHELGDKFDKEYTWCPRLQILPVIGADMNVYSCQDKAYNLDCGLLGSIKTQKFSEFWFNGKDKFYTINPSLHCNHHCVANNINKLITEYCDIDKGHLEFI